jgi:zinc transporter, ZIP family
MTTVAAERGGGRWRLWALVPVVLLVAAVSGFTATGSSLTGLLGESPPPADEFDVRRVELNPGEIRIRVTNPQREDLTIGTVTVDDAIVPFEVDGSPTLGRLRSRMIVVPYDWVADEPLAVGVTSSTGIQTTHEIAAAVETPGPSPSSFLGYAIIGLLVGVVPVALGMLWLPSLRRAAPKWLAAFMALTAGLLAFLAVEALSEALELQAALPSGLGGFGLVLLGVSISFLTLTFLSTTLARRGGGSRGALGGLALATLVAVGIGVHNFGEGLAIGSSFAIGELTLGTFLIVGFMVHNVTEGLAIAAPVAEGGRRTGITVLGALVLVAGAPAILGGWLGGFVTSDVLAVVFFAAAAGAALEVVTEVARHVARRAPGGLASPFALGGFLAGIVTMYLTGILAG